MPPGSAAITIGALIIVRAEAASSHRLLRHELVHVRQYRARGTARFLVRYLAGYLRWRLRGYSHKGAYRRIPAEIEAYWLERMSDPVL